MPSMQVTPATQAQMSYVLMTFRLLKDGKDLWRWTFLINPDLYQQTEPVRANVIQTIGGGYVDAFGRGLTTIRISGVSGWRLRNVTNQGVTDGWQHWQGFLEKIYRYFIDKTNEDDKHTYELRFYNWMDKEYWAVYFIDNLQWRRQAPQDSLWRRYDFTLVCLYPVPPPSDPASLQIAGQTVINQSDQVMSTVVDIKPQLLNIENDIWDRVSLIKQLVCLNNPTMLDKWDQTVIQAKGYYDHIEPNEELTDQNFPGIAKYTGKVGANNPPGTAMYIVDNELTPLANAIDNYRTGKTSTIAISYGNIAKYQNDIVTLVTTLSGGVYKPPPLYLIHELTKANAAIGKFVGHSDMFQS